MFELYSIIQREANPSLSALASLLEPERPLGSTCTETSKLLALDLEDKLFYGSVMRLTFVLDNKLQMESTLHNMFAYLRVFERNLGVEYVKTTTFEADNFVLLTLYLTFRAFVDNATRAIIMGNYFKDTASARSIVISSVYFYECRVEVCEREPQTVWLMNLGQVPEKIKKGFIVCQESKFQSSRNLMQEDFSWYWNPLATLSGNAIFNIWERQLHRITDDVNHQIFSVHAVPKNQLYLLVGNHGTGKSILLKRVCEKLKWANCALLTVTTKKTAFKLVKCQQNRIRYNNCLSTWSELILQAIQLMQDNNQAHLFNTRLLHSLLFGELQQDGAGTLPACQPPETAGLNLEEIIAVSCQCIYYLLSAQASVKQQKINTAVILVDDLQNSDVLSWRVLDELLKAEQKHMKIFIVCSFRYPLPNELCENLARIYEDSNQQLGVNLAKTREEYTEYVHFLDEQIAYFEQRAEIVALDSLTFSDLRLIIHGFFGYYFKLKDATEPLKTQWSSVSVRQFTQLIADKIIRAKGLDQSPLYLLCYLHEMARHQQIKLKSLQPASNTGILDFSDVYVDQTQNKQQLNMPVPSTLFCQVMGIVRLQCQPQIASLLKLLAPFRKLFEYSKIQLLLKQISSNMAGSPLTASTPF